MHDVETHHVIPVKKYLQIYKLNLKHYCSITFNWTNCTVWAYYTTWQAG